MISAVLGTSSMRWRICWKVWAFLLALHFTPVTWSLGRSKFHMYYILCSLWACCFNWPHGWGGSEGYEIMTVFAGISPAYRQRCTKVNQILQNSICIATGCRQRKACLDPWSKVQCTWSLLISITSQTHTQAILNDKTCTAPYTLHLWKKFKNACNWRSFCKQNNA